MKSVQILQIFKYEQLYTNNLDNLEKYAQILLKDTNDQSSVKKIGNLNCFISIFKMEFVVKKLPTKDSQTMA